MWVMHLIGRICYSNMQETPIGGMWPNLYDAVTMEQKPEKRIIRQPSLSSILMTSMALACCSLASRNRGGRFTRRYRPQTHRSSG